MKVEVFLPNPGDTPSLVRYEDVNLVMVTTDNTLTLSFGSSTGRLEVEQLFANKWLSMKVVE